MSTHTRLVQMPCSDLRKAGEYFSRQRDGECVLVLVPKRRLSPFIRIPSEAQPVMQKWGADIEPMPAGFRYLPPWYRVAYLVTKQSCNYNAPIQEAPTSDNVKIHVDVHFNFMIINAHDFVYKLGAIRFDELLFAAAEEAIRVMVRATSIDRVYELRGSQADELLVEVNDKFKPFGVSFSQANITNVQIPGDLQKSLQQATFYDSQLGEQKKGHNFRMDQLKKSAERAQIDTNNKNALIVKNMQAELDRRRITNEDEILSAQSEAAIAITRAKEKAAKTIRESEANYYTAKTTAEQQYHVLTQRATAQASADMVHAEQKSRQDVVWSEAELQSAHDEASATRAEADAEAKAAVQFAEKRENELEQARLGTMRRMAADSKLVFTGENGDRIIDAILESSTL